MYELLCEMKISKMLRQICQNNSEKLHRTRLLFFWGNWRLLCIKVNAILSWYEKHKRFTCCFVMQTSTYICMYFQREILFFLQWSRNKVNRKKTIYWAVHRTELVHSVSLTSHRSLSLLMSYLWASAFLYKMFTWVPGPLCWQIFITLICSSYFLLINCGITDFFTWHQMTHRNNSGE